MLPAGLIGASHPFVIKLGHDAMRNARPASAGFSMLYPNPPNGAFATSIANIDPANGNHHGAPGGTLNATSIPVIIALPSTIVNLRCMRLTISSANTAPTIPDSVNHNAHHP